MKAIKDVLPSHPDWPIVTLAENQEEYTPLPVVPVVYSNGVISMIACYKLGFRERLRVLFTGRVWTQRLTFGGPYQPEEVHASEPLKSAPYDKGDMLVAHHDGSIEPVKEESRRVH